MTDGGVEEDRTNGQDEPTEISEADGSVEEILEAPEPIPEAEAEPEVGEVEEEPLPDWSPVESPKIHHRLDMLAADLLDIEGVSMYRNDGKTKYIAFTMGARKTVACIYLGKRARVAVPISEGKGPVGWLSYKISEDGISLDGTTKRVRDIIASVKRYAKAREWA